MAGSDRIAAAVVVYNRGCGESETCRALLHAEDPSISVVIYDNSTKDYGNAAFCAEHGWTYLGGTGNVGLSRAYNACVDSVRDKADLLCLFDDDTCPAPDYFPVLRKAAASGGRLFAPVVRANGRILSPCILAPDFRTRLFASEDELFRYQGDSLTAINSGMAVSLDLFDDYRYDENLFLDGVDHHFVRDMASRGFRLQPIRCQLDHSFSGDEKPSREAAMTRFSIFCRDLGYLFREDPKAFRRIVGRRALHLSMQYRTGEFLHVYRRAAKQVEDGGEKK